MEKPDFTIRSIKPVPRKKNQFLISFDQQTSFKTDAFVISDLNLYEGKKLVYSEFENLQVQVEKRALKNYCFNILSKKMYTISELRQKLYRRTKNETIVTEIIQDLIRLKLLDDLEFKTLFLRSLTNKKKYSIREIKQKFYQKGLEFDSIANRLNEDYEIEIAQEIVHKKTMGGRESEITVENAKRLYAFLYRKGFQKDVIDRVISEYKNG